MENIKKIAVVLIKFAIVIALFIFSVYVSAILMVDFLLGMGLNVEPIDLMFFIVGFAMAADAVRNYINFGGFSK